MEKKYRTCLATFSMSKNQLNVQIQEKYRAHLITIFKTFLNSEKPKVNVLFSVFIIKEAE